MKPPLVIGNWKMHGTRAEGQDLASRTQKAVKGLKGVELALAPPFTALAAVGKVLKRGEIQLAAQNVHWEEEGAFTGEISPGMLREVGCSLVLIGHSERRRLFHEDDRAVARKMSAVLRADLQPVLCVGETLHERENGRTARVIGRQIHAALKEVAKNDIDRVVIAYEPVWAIGTGRNATPAQIARVHLRIREILKGLFGKSKALECRIVYGGSVRPENAGELAGTPGVNGLLVGGASLKAESFFRIVREFSRDMSGNKRT